MIDDLKRMFSRSWSAFVSELERREPEDEVAELLGAMRREMVAARAELPAMEDALRGAERALERERAAVADCERRRGQAERIGDAETMRVAEEYAGKHRERVAVLERKLEAGRAELELRRREADEMVGRYREADANRFGLVAELRRRRAAGTLGATLGGDDALGEEWERAADRVRDAAAYAEALDELSDDAPSTAPPPSEADVEARLEELKRRMGRA